MLSQFKRSPALVSLVLIGINLAVWLLQIIPNSELIYKFAFAPATVSIEPWRMLTAGFLHDQANPLHLLLNMYSLYIFGSVLEPVLGRLRFLALWLVSIFGGSVAVMYLESPVTWVLGASGGVFGLMAAYFVVSRAVGDKSFELIGLIGINLAVGIFMPGISWQAHLGGLLAGGAMAAVYVAARNGNPKTSRQRQLIGVIAVVLVFIALTVYRMNTMGF